MNLHIRFSAALRKLQESPSGWTRRGYGSRLFWNRTPYGEVRDGGKLSIDDGEHALSGENPGKETKMVGSKVAAVFRSEMTKLNASVIELGMRTSQDSVGRVDEKR